MNHLYMKNEIHFIIKTIGDFLPIINQSCENRDFVTGSCYSGLHSIVEIGELLVYYLQTLVKGTIFVKIISIREWNQAIFKFWSVAKLTERCVILLTISFLISNIISFYECNLLRWACKRDSSCLLVKVWKNIYQLFKDPNRIYNSA